jgi:outer membrane receptor protein involved in Fe transport
MKYPGLPCQLAALARAPGLLAALACALALSAHAQQAVQEVTTPMDTVVVTGKYDNSIGLWDAASEGAVTGEGIAKRPLMRTAEVVESVPGLIVTQHSGDGKANQYFLRGYNLDHGTDFATWIAGMPANMPTHAHGQGYMDLNFLIPELVSRMVYRKGPYYADDGDFASAGSAHIGYLNRLPTSLATLTSGSFDYRRALLAGSPSVGPGTLLYGVEYQQNDGGWDNPNRYAKWNGVLRYSQGAPADGFNVTAMGYDAAWNATDQIPQRAVDAGRVGRYGALDPTDGGSASRYSLSAEWRQSSSNTSRSASLYAVRSRLDLYSNFTFFQNDAANGDQFNQHENRTLLGGALGQTWTAALSGHESVTTAGLQLRQDRLSPVALYLTAGRARLATVREDRAKVTSIAPYVSNTFSWTEWFRSIAGLRADKFWFDVGSDNPANSGRQSASMVSPKLALAFGPWADTEYFLNWGKGFHSNDARGTTITIDPASGAAAQRVQPLVRTRGYEAGMRSQLVKGVTSSLSLWTLKQDSELLFVGDAGTTEPSRPSRRRGVEWLAEYTPDSRVTFDASLALTRARFADTDPAGPFIPGAPDRVASAGVTVEGFRGWSASVRWRYFGARPLVEDNSVRSRSTSLVNARLGYAFDKRARLSLDVYNLFNRKDNDVDYFYQSRLAGEPAAVADVHFHPVERRALRLALTLNY